MSQRYTYTVPEMIVSSVLPDMIKDSEMEDKQLECINFNFDKMQISLDFENLLSPADEAILSGMVENDLVKNSWIRIRRDEANNYTDNCILNGFTYNDSKFILDVEHEISYLGTYIMSSMLQYPYQIKGAGSDFVTLTSQEHFTHFIANAFGYMEATIKGAWPIKNALSGMTVEELKNWEDPRL